MVALIIPITSAFGVGPQTVGSVSLTLTPSSIRASNGASTSTSTAKATVLDTNGAPIPLATVNFGTDKSAPEAVTFSSNTATTGPDGTASVTITSSSIPDVQTISASTGGKSDSKLLTQFGPATTVTVALSPSTIAADGSSKSTATATAKDANGRGVADEAMAITTSGDTTIGPVTNNGDGTYTATITASKSADVETITAATSKEQPSVTGSAPLTETAGPATTITFSLSPTSIPADGATKSTATATVKDANSNPVKNETVTITTNGDTTIGSVANN
ncbi:MAG TPA: invasin domain 3-containing protein, partial [Mycobacteriales bacterium]|nr:invasin domain 3-containing protein [Mycobacteriales bacterium]